MARDTLGPLEHQVLAVLVRHPRDAYAVSIQERMREAAGSAPSLAAIYAVLERLERKGFVGSWWGDSTPERGGRRKRLYEIVAPGQRAMQLAETRAAERASLGGIWAPEAV